MQTDASIADVDLRTFERQVRLHLPSVSERHHTEAGYHEAYDAVRAIALVRAGRISQELEQAELHANASLLLPKTFRVRRDLTLEAADGSTLRLRFDAVKPSIGHIYQSHLHYLRSVRADTRLHFGLFLPGADYPLTYVSLSRCDRPYMADTLIASNLDCRREDCIVLTRMYGLPRLPPNLMSLTLRHVIMTLRQSKLAKVLLTAYNPLLGFDGAAFRASGFHPFATAPVTYKYTERGEFTTRRNGRDAARTGYGMPPNILLARGIDRSLQREINNQVHIVNISPADYRNKVKVDGTLPDIDASIWLKQLQSYRRLLESAWSLKTVHPSYLGEGQDGPLSRGQCGVSSVWLASELRDAFGVEATYCYGDLEFLDGLSASVNHHCWIEIGRRDDATRLVIDLTCDQAESLHEPVLCATHDDLVRQGMNYIARTRLSFEDLPADRVWHRYNNLSDAIAETLSPQLAR